MVAIISRAVEDAKSIIARCYGRKQSVYAKYMPAAVNYSERELKALKSEITHQWFGEICRYCGIHQDLVLRKITKLEERAKEKHARHQSAS